MNLRVAVTGKDKRHETRIRSESEPEEGEVVSQETKRTLCVRVGGGRRETKLSTHVQGEVRVTPDGGPHQ